MPYQADRCLITRAENACWDCGAIGPVVCLVLPYNLVTVEEDPEDSPTSFEGAVAMTYIQQLDPDLLAAINLPGFKLGASRTAEMTYYANHCEHCGALIGDHFLHHPDGPFWPEQQASNVVSLFLYDRPVNIQANSWSSLCFPLLEYELAFEGSPVRHGRRAR